jgi:hypothetical protein
MSPSLTDDPPLTLDERGIKDLTEQYLSIARQLARCAGVSPSDMSISMYSLSMAFAEAAADLEIMSIRRKPKAGISPSKIAGIVAFRLARFAPINILGASSENDSALKLNELAALSLAMRSILFINIADVKSVHATMELQYTLVRRHMNQETLGLAFEILSTLVMKE